MIQTTIQNSCAVDDYKTSWNVCLTAQCSESQCEYIILLLSFPKTTTVMRAAAHCVHLQKETCKKKKPEWKKEKKQKQNAFRLYTDVGPLPGRTTERRPYHVRRVATSSCA